MPAATLLICLPLVAALALAAVVDLRRRRIPNWLTLPLMIGGLTLSFTAVGLVSPGGAMLGFAAGFTLAFVPFALGAMGGGDVKLLAAVGMWVGWERALAIFAVAAIVGMIMVLAQAIAQGRVRVLLRNTAVLAISAAHVGDLGKDHLEQTGKSCRSVDKPLPYAVPVLLASLVVLSWFATEVRS